MSTSPPGARPGKFVENVFTAYPTTYVVDRNGNIVGDPIVGAITDKSQMESLNWPHVNRDLHRQTRAEVRTGNPGPPGDPPLGRRLIGTCSPPFF